MFTNTKPGLALLLVLVFAVNVGETDVEQDQIERQPLTSQVALGLEKLPHQREVVERGLLRQYQGQVAGDPV